MHAQLPLPHHSMKFVDSADFLALSPYAKASYLVLERRVKELRCRGRVEGAMNKPDSWWVRTLGISRRSRRALESTGLIRIDVAALVLVHYDVEEEVKASAFRERQRQLGQAGAAARWGRPEHAEEIPEEIPEEFGDLSERNLSFDAMASGNGQRQWPVEQIFSESRDPLGSGDPQPPSNEGPLCARSDLKRVAPASRPLVANLVLRRRKVGPAPSAPPARLSARAGQRRRDVRPPAPGPEASKPGGAAGPSFEVWYERYRRLTGVPFRREVAVRVWAWLGMDAAERRALWEFSEMRARVYSADFKAPNPARFLRAVWWPELKARRRQARHGGQGAAGDVLAVVLENLKGRRT